MRFRFHGEARIELIAAAEWYESERSGLGDELVDEVARALQVIAAHPDAWPAVGPRQGKLRARRLIVPRFPYALVFATRGDEVLVLAVAHAKRKPGYWRQRLR